MTSQREKAVRGDAESLVDALVFVLKRWAELESMQLAPKASTDKLAVRSQRQTYYLDEQAGHEVREIMRDFEKDVRHWQVTAVARVSALTKLLHAGPPPAVMYGPDAYMEDPSEHGRLVAQREKRLEREAALVAEGGSYKPTEQQRRPAGR